MQGIRLFAALILMAIAGSASALGVEVFTSAGPARWSECGSNGCWRQPPLPAKFELKTDAASIGARVGDFEISWRDLGKASVRGTFVADSDYDSDRATVAHGARKIEAFSEQRTEAAAFAYAPRFAWGNVSASPSLGAALVRQEQTFAWLGKKGEITNEGRESNFHRWTAFAGVRLAYHFERMSIGVGAEWFHRPRYVNSVAGGGSDHPVGLRIQFVELRARVQ